MTRRCLRTLSIAVVALVSFATLSLAEPAAAVVTAKVSGTEGLGLFVRPTPDQGGAPIVKLAEGTTLRLDCWIKGQTIAGYWYTGDTWHRISSPAVGYVSDTYVYTGTNGPAPGEPRCSGSPPATGGPRRPSGEIAFPATTSTPRAKKKANAAPSVLKEQFKGLINLCTAASWWNCAGLGLHYLDRTGSPVAVSMPDLLWRQRPAWASLEWQLRDHAPKALARAKATPAKSSATVPFDTNWYVYNATGKNDWHYALGHFSIRLKGDLWIGPADARGVRPIQLRYRVFLFDVYDFGPTGEFAKYAKLHDEGRAAEFLVTGFGKTITRQYTTSNFRPASLGLEW